MDKSVLIAIPAFNEEKTISHVLEIAKKHGEVIVFNNNSTDDTKKKSILKKVRIVDVKQQGYESVIYAIANYFKCSKYMKLIIIDGDGEVGLNSIKSMINALNENDIVTGQRDKIYRPSEKIICFLFETFFGIKDVFCGFKGFTHNGINNNFAEGTYSTSVFNKRAKKISIPVSVLQRTGESRLGSGIELEIKLLIGGLRGFFL